MALVHCVWVSHLMKHNCFMFSNHFPFFSETVYSCFLLGSVDSTQSLLPRLSTLNQSMTQEILHTICLLIPCLAPPFSSLIT
ncbi:hypothetical protein NC653_040601 [Populus alba x Populus x berolinensis]|uniref:Uncharacterized protein n=1 Tax=Populus alba x Populus x berolinensis TaxID=444605 RepID=A0AAD6L6I5_9ROSI|nr:hypothetical protein NC653_040601 [Populus alba x Populus x berolinensis]